MPSLPAQTGASNESELSRSARQQVTQVAALPEVHRTFQWFRDHQRDLSDAQIELTAIPAPPFGERARAEWFQERFSAAGLSAVEIDEIGNVVAYLPGATPVSEGVVAVTAHLDTVFPGGTPLKVRRQGDRILGPGVSDNGAGLTALLALAESLQQSGVKPTMPILFVCNVGEEGEGDVRGMRYLFNKSEWGDVIKYTLVLDGAGTDSIVTQALGSKRFQVVVRGPGGHSWSDFGVPNPIVALSRAIAEFNKTVVPTDPKTTFNIGVIEGGTSVNSIPEEATMRVDLRSASPDEITKLEKSLREVLDRAMIETSAVVRGRRREPVTQQLSYEMKLIGNRPAAELKPNSRILATVQAVDALLNNAARLQRASTDANIPLSLGREAVAIGAGGSGGGAHTLHEWYDPTTRELGLKRIILTLLALSGVQTQPK
ncbi:MAG TPA: M20/M25/M40 family metallo-hydrolase [Terriglobales bacterium]|nr:M20/M25/M40 family metallo-hydrolase [Terriglobales bacterium]